MQSGHFSNARSGLKTAASRSESQIQDGAVWVSARRMIGDGCLSILMPARNLASAIAENVMHVHQVFTEARLAHEIVVIDDGSTDSTADEIRTLAGTMPELRPVILDRNAGKGAALKRGFEVSRGDFVLLLDGDLDLPPSQVSGFFDIMESANADMVIGSKLHPRSSVSAYPWHRKLASLLYFMIVKTLIGLPVRDTQTGIKLFRRKVLEYAFPRLLVKRFAFDLELLAVAHEKGFSIAESPISLRPEGKWGRIPLRTGFQVAVDTLAIFYRLRILKYYQSIPDTSMPEPAPAVSVLIACPANSPYLCQCLAALRTQTFPPDEIIILPDSPTGMDLPPGAREIPTGRARPGRKRNIGLAAAGGDIIAFIDDDAIPDPSWIEQALRYFSNESIAAVGGPAVTPIDEPFMSQLSGRVFSSRLVSGRHRCRYVPTRVHEVDDFPTCNLFVRSAVLRALGGFKEEFWPGEDTHLCMQIRHTLGKSIIYDPRVSVAHHRRPLFGPHLRQVGRYGFQRGYFARRFGSTSLRLEYFLPSLVVAGALSGALSSFLVPAIRAPYLAAWVIYLAATFVSSASLSPVRWLLVWAGMIATHFVYGTRFAAGFLAGAPQAQPSSIDHPSENAAPADSAAEEMKRDRT